MGTCYSKSGHDIDSGRTNRPRGRKKNSQENEHAEPKENHRLVINVPIQKDLSDTVYTEDSHIVTTDAADCINKSQQTSLDRLTRDSNKNIESLTDCGNLEQNGCDVIRERNAKLKDHCSDVAQELIQNSSKHLHLRNGNVSTSDSGIVLEMCKCCERAEVSKDTNDEYSEDFEIQINSSENETDPVACSTNTTDLVTDQCFCTKNCISHGHRLVTDCSNTCSCHGECQGHLFSKSSMPYHVNTSSHSLLFKSSLKKKNTRLRQKKVLSWKSADGLDWVECMDRTKSVCSSIFGDGISLLNAPLATFDSVDFTLGSSYDYSKNFQEGINGNQIDYCSDVFQFDFSGLEGDIRQSIPSIDRLSVSNTRIESTTELDKRLATCQNPQATPTEQR